MIQPIRSSLFVLVLLSVWSSFNCFTFTTTNIQQCIQQWRANNSIDTTTIMYSSKNAEVTTISRRDILRTATAIGILDIMMQEQPSNAATVRESLDELLYRIVRVREATVMETRLIKSGSFKDVQRSNIKLAVRFMVDNYRLNDAFVSASTYLDGTNRRLEATQLGQSATQNLITILEYFDSSDVENLKVGQTSLSGDKVDIVLKGLEATRKNIDDYLSLFPSSDVTSVVARVNDENDANVKEFDSSLGPLLNMPKAV